MNKTALKRLAIGLRQDLIDEVGAKIDYLLSFDEASLPAKYRAHTEAIQKLKEDIDKEGKEVIVEKVAYMWANRFIAMRYMDATGINSPMVVSPKAGETQPEIFAEAKAGYIDDELKIDKERFYALLDGKINEEDPQNEAYGCSFWLRAGAIMS